MNSSVWRLPAEWEPQDAILLAWPHEDTDWQDNLDEVLRCYQALIAAITRYQAVVLVVRDHSMAAAVRQQLADDDVDLSRVSLLQHDYNDTWCRDIGPLTLLDSQQNFRFLDFRFTGWGGKFDAGRDDALVGALVASGRFVPLDHQRIDFALEGGAIESDGQGTLLSTWRCLQQRHPTLSRDHIDSQLRAAFDARHIHWLERGYLAGDDTDAHIDTLARFSAVDALVYQACDDSKDEHYQELQAMAAELAALRQSNGASYHLYALPWPRAIHDSNGRRLAASYANYLLINNALLMPAYGDPADQHAAEVLRAAHPDREIISIDCRALIVQNGSLHCVSMQLPGGILNAGYRE